MASVCAGSLCCPNLCLLRVVGGPVPAGRRARFPWLLGDKRTSRDWCVVFPFHFCARLLRRKSPCVFSANLSLGCRTIMYLEYVPTGFIFFFKFHLFMASVRPFLIQLFTVEQKKRILILSRLLDLNEYNRTIIIAYFIVTLTRLLVQK